MTTLFHDLGIPYCIMGILFSGVFIYVMGHRVIFYRGHGLVIFGRVTISYVFWGHKSVQHRRVFAITRPRCGQAIFSYHCGYAKLVIHRGHGNVETTRNLRGVCRNIGRVTLMMVVGRVHRRLNVHFKGRCVTTLLRRDFGLGVVLSCTIIRGHCSTISTLVQVYVSVYQHAINNPSYVACSSHTKGATSLFRFFLGVFCATLYLGGIYFTIF